jgi:hypothetical protein
MAQVISYWVGAKKLPILSLFKGYAKQWGNLDCYMRKCWADRLLMLGFQVFETELFCLESV